jgi:hypothetical protein
LQFGRFMSGTIAGTETANGAPFRIKPRTHTQLKLLVILPNPDRPAAIGTNFGLTRSRWAFQPALTTACALIARIVVLSSGASKL